MGEISWATPTIACYQYVDVLQNVFIPYLSLTKRHRAQAQSGHFQPTAAEVAVGQLHIATGHLESNSKVKGHEHDYLLFLPRHSVNSLCLLCGISDLMLRPADISIEPALG